VRGTVTEFDDHRGLGSITTDDAHVFPFHCTAIADGSRTIVIGTNVEFAVLPKLGRYEATSIRPAGS
jgi:cold shock CspA family protein